MTQKIYRSGKIYGHDRGLTCSWIDPITHNVTGCSIKVHLEFAASKLDERNFVVDFGGLKNFKGWLEDTFDHTFLIATDDPQFERFAKADEDGLIQLTTLPEGYNANRFAEMIYEVLDTWLTDAGFAPRCEVYAVKVFAQEQSKSPFSQYQNPKFIQQAA